MAQTLGPFLMLAIMIVGFGLILQVISRKKAGSYLKWIILAALFGPMLYSMARAKAADFLAGPHAWWEYGILILVLLIALRLFLNFLFPWRRRW